MRALLICLMMLTWVAGTGAGAQEPADPDILCQNAPEGTVADIPPPLDQWIIVLCTPDGQVLLPRLRDEVEMWLERKTGSVFRINAAPPGALGGTPSITKYDLRFESFSGRLASGPHRRLLLELWMRAFDQPQVPENMGSVYQLDATTVYEGETVNLFVYLRGDEPRWMVFCRDRCRIGAALDVLRGAELEARVQAQERPAR